MRYLIHALCLLILAQPVLAAEDPRSGALFGPQVSPKGVVFRYYLPGASQVRIAGDWSDWEANVILEPGNSEGYFETTLPLFKKKKYRYKLVVDGIWQRDYENPNREFDMSGDEISWFEIKRENAQYGDNPVKVRPEYWRFYYKDEQARYVSLVGSFNNFNPYEAVMKRDASGVWVAEVQVFPGEHSYCFVVDGKWKIDPDRKAKGYTRFGQYFSVFVAD